MKQENLQRANELYHDIKGLKAIIKVLEEDMSSVSASWSQINIETGRLLLKVPTDIYIKILPQLKDMLSVELSKLEKEFEEL
jgi:hypothetical protein